MTKYRNKKTQVMLEGQVYKFDSKKEANHFGSLINLLKMGVISELRLQPEFDIIPQVKHNGKTLSKIKYIADFAYKQNDMEIVVDVKASATFQTDVYKLKKRLFLLQYPQYKFIEVL